MTGRRLDHYPVLIEPLRTLLLQLSERDYGMNSEDILLGYCTVQYRTLILAM